MMKKLNISRTFRFRTAFLSLLLLSSAFLAQVVPEIPGRIEFENFDGSEGF